MRKFRMTKKKSSDGRAIFSNGNFWMICRFTPRGPSVEIRLLHIDDTSCRIGFVCSGECGHINFCRRILCGHEAKVAKIYEVRCTVRMKSLTIISGELHLLHHFKSDFAHLLAFKNLVIELLNAKKRPKNNNKINY